MQPFEKEVIKFIVSLNNDFQPISVSTIVKHFLPDRGIKVNLNKNLVYLLFSHEKYEKPNSGGFNVETAKEIYPTIVIVVKIFTLIRKLELQGSIRSFDLAERGNEYIAQSFTSNVQGVHLIFPEKEVAEYIHFYITKDIVLSSELIEFANRDFKTEEEIKYSEEQKKYKETRTISVVAIAVAFICAIIVPYLPSCEPDSSVTKSQIDSAIYTLSEQNRKLDSISNSIREHKISLDTLNVKIKQPITKVIKKKKTGH